MFFCRKIDCLVQPMVLDRYLMRVRFVWFGKKKDQDGKKVHGHAK
jgi:hypothetical protein